MGSELCGWLGNAFQAGRNSGRRNLEGVLPCPKCSMEASAVGRSRGQSKGSLRALSSTVKILSHVGVMEPDLSWGDHAGC